MTGQRYVAAAGWGCARLWRLSGNVDDGVEAFGKRCRLVFGKRCRLASFTKIHTGFGCWWWWDVDDDDGVDDDYDDGIDDDDVASCCIFTSLSIEKLLRFAVLEIVRSIAPLDLLVPCSRPIRMRVLAWARALPRFIDHLCSILPRRQKLPLITSLHDLPGSHHRIGYSQIKNQIVSLVLPRRGQHFPQQESNPSCAIPHSSWYWVVRKGRMKRMWWEDMPKHLPVSQLPDSRFALAWHMLGLWPLSWGRQIQCQ